MSRKCDICGKGVQTGNNVSHSNLKTKKRWKPNTKKIRVIKDGKVANMNVCTRCMRGNKVTRPVVAKSEAVSA